MADGTRDTNQSVSSTRRSSDTSAPPTSQNPSLLNSALLPDQGRRRPATLSTQSDAYGTLSRQPTVQTLNPRAKKPAALRRISSHLPYKGQEFSVDDAEDEIEKELERQKKQERLAKSTGSLRGQSTLRRRTTAKVPTLAKVPSAEEEDDDEDEQPEEVPGLGESSAVAFDTPDSPAENDADETPTEEQSGDIDEDDDDGDTSDAESFTLKDRQDAINVTHPFGIRIWKPALYKKKRSVQKTADEEIHSNPGLHVSPWLLFFNYLWTVLFGWWLFIVCFVAAIVCFVFGILSTDSRAYGHVLLGLSGYLFYPFGKFINLLQDEAYAEEDEGEGRSITEYEQWQSGDIEEGRLFFGPLDMNRSLVGRRRTSVESADETQSLLGRHRRGERQTEPPTVSKTRFFGRGTWNFGRVVFFLLFHLIVTPCLLLACAACWLMIFSIPMGKLTFLLWDHLRRHPLALSFHAQGTDLRYPGLSPSSVLVCTYRAVGLKYWKYTIDGTNIFLFNLLAIVAFTIFDYFVLVEALHLKLFITAQGLIFALALFSIIPLAYFIGQAVASISAQSSMGVGATINAFFSTIVEVYLYCIALAEGKSQLVEGSIIGSIFAGILFLPGLSMCFGALKRKTQRFNVKSAGVTSTMMLFAMIGVFGPTLFYQIYGSHELKCHECKSQPSSSESDCRRCFFSQLPAVHDRFWTEAVLPFCWVSAAALFLAYVIGLLFTLRTHAAIIWTSELDEKKGPDLSVSQLSAPVFNASPETLTRQPTSGTIVTAKTDIRETQLYQRVLGQSLKQSGVGASTDAASHTHNLPLKSPHIVPPKGRDTEEPQFGLDRFSEAENMQLTRQMAEMAATAAVAAARDTIRLNRKTSHISNSATRLERAAGAKQTAATEIDAALHPELATQEAGGHDAPNWSKVKSAVILLTATVAYAIIAEILVNTVDAVLDNVAIDQKFLGITLFALVPNTTEFLNAISFAMNGNIALSMEIGSAYALQVCLLQIPALVLYSAVYGRHINPEYPLNYIFTLIFPQWDMVTVILCVFLLSYMYGEGKSNYFKGSILILAYIVVIVGFWFAGFDVNGAKRGVIVGDTLAVGQLGALKQLVHSGKEFDLH